FAPMSTSTKTKIIIINGELLAPPSAGVSFLRAIVFPLIHLLLAVTQTYLLDHYGLRQYAENLSPCQYFRPILNFLQCYCRLIGHYFANSQPIAELVGVLVAAQTAGLGHLRLTHQAECPG